MKQFATITVIGRDKTGVIARVTNFLFEQEANIVDLGRNPEDFPAPYLFLDGRGGD